VVCLVRVSSESLPATSPEIDAASGAPEDLPRMSTARYETETPRTVRVRADGRTVGRGRG